MLCPAHAYTCREVQLTGGIAAAVDHLFKQGQNLPDTGKGGREECLGVDFKLNHLYGAYFVAGRRTDSGALAGYTEAQAEASGSGVGVKEDDSDISYGLGTDYDVDENVAGSLECIRYMDKHDSEFDAINPGLIYKF